MRGGEIRARELRTCYLCGGQGRYLYRGLIDHLFAAPGEWGARKCETHDCGLLWLDPMPLEEDLPNAYRLYHTHHEARTELAEVGGFLRSALRRAYALLRYAVGMEREYRRSLLSYLDETPPGRLLDVGCGNGDLLVRLRERGWEVEGQEADPEAAAEARRASGAHVYLGRLDEAGFPDGRFAAVTVRHVLEHVHDPIGLLRECHRILKPGGVLVAATPNIEIYGHQQFGGHWRGLEPPRHLYLFSALTLGSCATRAGFNAVETWTTPVSAEWFYLASLAVREGVAEDEMLANPGLARRARAVAFLLTEVWRKQSRPLSGEELLLRAVR